jgi:hypothetical protein
MRVLLRPEVFTTEHHLELMVLLWLGSIGRHRIVPDPLDQAEHATWVTVLDGDTRRLWDEMMRASLDREMSKPAHWEIVVTAAGDAAWQRPTPSIPIGAAVDLLLQPYRIVLENNVNDRAFLLALCGRAEAKTLEEAERRAWVVFEMGGGSTIVPRVQEIRRTEPLRRMASVLIDSDAMRPPEPHERREDVDGNQARNVRREAGDPRVGVHVHVLRRRAIENYLPLVALRRGTTGQERAIAALNGLSSEQRHHFNMKEGFDRDAPHAARTGKLYDKVAQHLRDRLRSGFGTDIAKLFSRTVRVEDAEGDAHAEVNAFVTEILARMR